MRRKFVKQPISPELFARTMELLARGDIEGSHVNMDRFMCHVLVQLGYDEGVKVFKGAHKFYA